MGIRLTSEEGKTALYDSVSGFAFGPVFDTEVEAAEFADYAESRLNKALNKMLHREIDEVYATWLMSMEGSR